MKHLVILAVSLISATAALAQTPTPAPTPDTNMVAGGVYFENKFNEGPQGIVAFQVKQTDPQSNSSTTFTTECLYAGQGAGLQPKKVQNGQYTILNIYAAKCKFEEGGFRPGDWKDTGAALGRSRSQAYPMFNYAYVVKCDNTTQCSLNPTQATLQSHKPAKQRR
jgi:hypothetical protein